ncbi:MAG: hypothetical protein WCH34_11875 [Bacteroidota bacterium]
MKGKAFEIASIILLFDVLIVGAVLAFTSFAPADTLVRFMDWDALSSLGTTNQNQFADSLINNYEKEDSVHISNNFSKERLIELRKKKDESYIYNPDSIKVSFLDNFFSALGDSINPKSLRIAHFGDSQLEGDRVTCFLRQKFQQKFGGFGLGFMPLTDIATGIDYSSSASENWIRYTVFHNRCKSSFYGLSGTLFRFSKYEADRNSENEISNKKHKSIHHSGMRNAWVSYHLQSAYQTLSIMYGNCNSPCYINLYDLKTSEIILTDTLQPCEDFTIHKFELPSNPLSFKIEYISDESPDFYGVLLDGDKGVQVDNYAIRGHSGDGLLNINPAFLAKQINVLNTKLIVFQYGANVVPYIKNEKECNTLEQVYYKLFMRFKSNAPNTSILVIGAGDMARSVKGEYESYAMLPQIKDAQKRAALKAGCAFWDLYEIMGGEDAILTWSKKGLASYDGHLTLKGQKLISEKLFNALMVEYNLYLYRKKFNS